MSTQLKTASTEVTSFADDVQEEMENSMESLEVAREMEVKQQFMEEDQSDAFADPDEDGEDELGFSSSDGDPATAEVGDDFDDEF